MPRGPAHAGAGPEPGDPVPAPDWMTEEDWEAWCDARAADDEPPPDPSWDEEEDEDPELAAGEQVAWPAGFAKGAIADGLPGGSALAFLADAAAGDDDRYAGATDGELDGLIAAWDRVEAHASARKHLAIAEFIRRRPEKGCEPEEPGGMPAQWDEFAIDELRVLLADSKAVVERMMDRAQVLAQRLPGTMALYRSGGLRQSKVTIIVDVTAPLDDGEAKAAEEQVLGRAAQLTPSGLRDAIGVATMRATSARVGGTVRMTISDPDGRPHQASFRVIGRASLNAGTSGLGNGAVMTTSAFVSAQCPGDRGAPPASVR